MNARGLLAQLKGTLLGGLRFYLRGSCSFASQHGMGFLTFWCTTGTRIGAAVWSEASIPPLRYLCAGAEELCIDRGVVAVLLERYEWDFQKVRGSPSPIARIFGTRGKPTLPPSSRTPFPLSTTTQSIRQSIYRQVSLRVSFTGIYSDFSLFWVW